MHLVYKYSCATLWSILLWLCAGWDCRWVFPGGVLGVLQRRDRGHAAGPAELERGAAVRVPGEPLVVAGALRGAG